MAAAAAVFAIALATLIIWRAHRRGYVAGKLGRSIAAAACVALAGAGGLAFAFLPAWPGPTAQPAALAPASEEPDGEVTEAEPSSGQSRVVYSSLDLDALAQSARAATETVPARHVLTFMDWTGAVMKVLELEEGTPASRIDAPDPPARPDDGESSYAFTGWSPPLSEVAADVTYVATYAATPLPTPEPEPQPEIMEAQASPAQPQEQLQPQQEPQYAYYYEYEEPAWDWQPDVWDDPQPSGPELLDTTVEEVFQG